MNKNFSKFMLTSASALALLAAYPSIASSTEAFGFDLPVATVQAATTAKGFLDVAVPLPTLAQIGKMNQAQFDQARNKIQSARGVYNQLSAADKENVKVARWAGYLAAKENAVGNTFIDLAMALPTVAEIKAAEGEALAEVRAEIDAVRIIRTAK